MLTLSSDTFDSMLGVLGPAVVDFWNPDCGPCKTLEPIFERLSSEYSGKLTFAKLNIADNEGIAQRHDIMGLPCLVVFRNGAEVERIVGNFPEASLRRKLDAVLAKVQQ